MSWIPQQYADGFSWVKAVLAGVAAVLLILHMLRIWPSTRSPSQKLRFIILLGYALITCFASADLAHRHQPVTFADVLTFLITVGLIVVTVLSAREWSEETRSRD